MTMRFRLPPGGDVPSTTAARRMGLTETEFLHALPSLLTRGFPRADPTTGNFDIDAIDEWRRRRHEHSYGAPQDARKVVASRIASAAWAR
ncbi:hypothetical protein SAMN05444161_4740 [Rhizobiales bacterium GAS191]|nr:hypothetical protein SAMN05444161_4740 [Rhizobiales bacterium GAS191]